MNKFIVSACAALSLCAVVLPAVAQDKKSADTTCPACKMTMTAKKTDKTTVAVQLKKGAKVLYCCDHCKMDPKIVVKSKKSDTKM